MKPWSRPPNSRSRPTISIGGSRVYESAPRSRSLLLKPPRPTGGDKRLDDRGGAVIEEEVKANDLSLLPFNKSRLMKAIHARRAAEGLTKRAGQTVDNPAGDDQRAGADQAPPRPPEGARRAQSDLRGSSEAGRALDILRIAHTPADMAPVRRL